MLISTFATVVWHTTERCLTECCWMCWGLAIVSRAPLTGFGTTREGSAEFRSSSHAATRIASHRMRGEPAADAETAVHASASLHNPDQDEHLHRCGINEMPANSTFVHKPELSEIPLSFATDVEARA